MLICLREEVEDGESHRLHSCVIECQAWQLKMPFITKP